nr:FMN-binding split barrel [Tanacetum cinerariifolium]
IGIKIPPIVCGLTRRSVIDEWGSFAVTSPLSGSLASLLQSLKKIQPPNRVALIGEVVPLGDKKV